jgi:hypothetical protein
MGVRDFVVVVATTTTTTTTSWKMLDNFLVFLHRDYPHRSVHHSYWHYYWTMTVHCILPSSKQTMIPAFVHGGVVDVASFAIQKKDCLVVVNDDWDKNNWAINKSVAQ